MTKSFILYGVGSAICVEFVETCKRAGHVVFAGIANRTTPCFLPDQVPQLTLGEVDQDTRSLPCLCPLFTPSNRYAATTEAIQLGFAFAEALVDPTSIVASDVTFGGGTYVNAGVIVGAASIISDHVLINRGSSIGHHARISEYVSIGPSVCLAGQITIGRGAIIGAGATIAPKVTIGPHAVVGAGAVVLADVPAYRRVFGVPAKIVEGALAGFGD